MELTAERNNTGTRHIEREMGPSLRGRIYITALDLGKGANKMFTALKKHCLTIITTFFGLAAVLCFAAASFAWDNFEFSEASLPTYERLRGVPEKELPKAIKKAVLTSSK